MYYYYYYYYDSTVTDVNQKHKNFLNIQESIALT